MPSRRRRSSQSTQTSVPLPQRRPSGRAQPPPASTTAGVFGELGVQDETGNDNNTMVGIENVGTATSINRRGNLRESAVARELEEHGFSLDDVDLDAALKQDLRRIGAMLTGLAR